MLNINQENYITSRALATLLGLTSERIRQLEDEGVFSSITKSGKKYFDLAPSISSYIEHIKEKTVSDSEGKDLLKEQAQADLRWKKARAGKMELELQELEGQMHRSEDVEIVVTDILARIRASILAIPGMLAVDVSKAKTAAEAAAVIKAAVDNMLNELSEYKYDPADYRKLVQEREKWLTVQEAQTAKAEKAKAEQPKTEKKTTTKKTATKKTTTKSRTQKQRSSSKTSRKS